MMHRLIIWKVAFLHIAWGLLLFLNGSGLHTTALNGIVRIFQPYWFAAILLFGAGISSMLGMYCFTKTKRAVVFFIPAQFFLLTSTFTVLSAIVTQQFADGVFRAWEFIAADQAYLLILVVLYTYVILSNYGAHKTLPKIWKSHQS